MLFLIPLGLSLLSAGVGIANQVAENKNAAKEGAKAVAEQIQKNQIDRIDQHAEYIRTVDAIDEENKELIRRAADNTKKGQSELTLALYLTAGLMVLLTVAVALTNKPTGLTYKK